MTPTSPPYPLPDLPRAAPSELASLICRVLEWRDMEALTRLPDKLRDLDRHADADQVFRIVASCFTQRLSDDSTIGSGWRWLNGIPNRYSWSLVYHDLMKLFMWDIFDWCGVVTRAGRMFHEQDEKQSPQTSSS